MSFKRLKVLIISLFIALSLVLPLFFKSVFIQHLLVASGINIILVMSLDMMVGHVGLLSLGHAGFMGIGAYTCALLAINGTVPFLPGLLGGMVAAAAFGALIGYPSLRLKGHYFVILTFICGIILVLLFTNLVAVTKGPMGIPGIPFPKIAINANMVINVKSKVQFYYLVLAFVFLTLYVKYRLYYSRMGMVLFAIREDEDLGKSVGIYTHAYKLWIFIISTGFAGIAGGLYAHYTRFIGPDSFSMVHSFYLFVMNLVGGSGTIVGPIIGPLLLTVIDQVSQRFQPAIGRILYGLSLVLIILYAPKGIMGFIKHLISQRGI